MFTDLANELRHHHEGFLEKYSLVGGFNPSEKYESVGMMTFPIYGKS